VETAGGNRNWLREAGEGERDAGEPARGGFRGWEEPGGVMGFIFLTQNFFGFFCFCFNQTSKSFTGIEN